MARTAKDRDDMVKRVNAAYSKWPSFEDLPTVTGGDIAAELKGSAGASAYISALYEVCKDGEVTGRYLNEVKGKKIA